jgi:hypothetical protein
VISPHCVSQVQVVLVLICALFESDAGFVLEERNRPFDPLNFKDVKLLADFVD